MNIPLINTNNICILIFLSILLAATNGYAEQVVLNSRKPISSQLLNKNTEYVIRHNFNLNGEIITVPHGCTLIFEESGRLINGSLRGDSTLIKSSKNKIFKKINFIGTFKSKESRPEWFVSIVLDKALNQCIKLFQGVLLDNTYNIDSTILIENSVSISGRGSLHFKNNVGECFHIVKSGVSVTGLQIYVDNIESTIVHALGNKNTPLNDINITSCLLYGGKYSIVFDFCDNSCISNCIIKNVDYTGIGLYSTRFIQVENNVISDINLSHNYDVSYGVTATYHYGDKKSTDIIISNNVVSNNPYWEGLGTHGGERIIFSNNTIENCWRGVSAVGDNHRDIMLCNEIVIEGNTITCSKEPLSNGIVFTGVGVGNLSTNINVLRNKVLYSVIALYSNHNDKVSISSNSLFATDEIWRDVGSKDIVFENNKVELSSDDASYYDKCVFYFKPTETVADQKFGDIINNSITTSRASIIKFYRPLSNYNSTLVERGNTIKQ